jgi:hypothetical protein
MSEEARRAEKRDSERRALAANEATAQYATWLDSHEASEALGFTDMHTKALARKGKLKSVKIKFRGYTKRLFEPESIAGYESKAFGPTGMRRYILRIDPDHVNIESVRAFLSTTYGDNGTDQDTGDVIWTLEKPKTSKAKAKDPKDVEPFVPTIVGAGLPPEATEPSQPIQDESDDDS